MSARPLLVLWCIVAYVSVAALSFSVLRRWHRNHRVASQAVPDAVFAALWPATAGFVIFVLLETCTRESP